MPIDHNVVSTERYNEEQIIMSEEICTESAREHGYTADESDLCDEDNPLCGNDCPFIKAARSPHNTTCT